MAGKYYIEAAPGRATGGSISVPGDKSISHRALMFGAIAEGVTTVSGFLAGEDCLATMAALQALGVKIETADDDSVTIHGVGMQGLQPAAEPLDMGNSGTGLRLMAGLLSGQQLLFCQQFLASAITKLLLEQGPQNEDTENDVEPFQRALIPDFRCITLYHYDDIMVNN